MSTMPELTKRPARGAAQRKRTGSRTLVACISCKDRKLKCDEQVPACGNCRRSGQSCFVEDPLTKRHQPRNYLETLEQRVLLLEEQLRQAESCKASEPSPSSNTQSTFSDQTSSTTVEAPLELDDLSSMIGTLSLNAAGAEPSYLGASSAFAFARFFKPSIRQAVASLPPEISSISRSSVHGHISIAPEPCHLPDYQTAVKLSNAYFHNFHPQYPFLHEPTFRMWETVLEDPIEAMSSLGYDPVPLYFLNMVYAIGALLRPDLGYSAEQLYVSAMLYIDEIICNDNLECIQAILCCAAYSLRSSKGTSHWKLGGQALRQCVNLGYHRNQKRLRSTLDPLQRELQKRAFWSAYVMECSAAVMLGRPLSLHYQEIDAEFPIDIHESQISSAGIYGNPRSSPEDPPTIMTHAIHGFRIRALIGRIQTALYSDSTLKDATIRQALIQHLSDELEEWYKFRPTPMTPPQDGALAFFVSADWYEANYNYAVLQLFRPQITDMKGSVLDETFLKCLTTSKKTCHIFRRQYFGKPMAYTWSAVHELFLAGLTYLYCLWMSPAARQISRHDQVSNTCMDCTMVLVILAERWPEAAPFRNIFEVLTNRTMTMLSDAHQGKEITSSAIGPESETYPEGLSQWMEGISGSGITTGVDWLLSELIDEFPAPE
ncbi:fungal-specific transcription factor domain-containing protein [Fusarium tricinctum]|uniref:Fungal-specific transcription factor domain-containing protein n=1 Tax=Fusarium tricinctum TaxID=61284 RepID=A0A8K0RXX8_9HYPO|nr:fungal-specific transcription factor domain-containing protein [Fusarium tricinctum]